MIRVTLANGTSELLEREIEPRRPDETLYDFMLRSAHEATLEARALRALLDAHMTGLRAERAAVMRQRRTLLLGQSIVAGVIAAALFRPDTLGDGCIMVLPVAVFTTAAGLALARIAPWLDQRLMRAVRWWRQ
jgi:hypothetical protein